MPWYIFSGLYLVIWSALLIHCWFQREFYPIFGRRLGTRCLWLFTFIFLNPLLTLIYFVFGFLLSFYKPKADEHGATKQTSVIGFGSAVAIAMIGIVVVFFELPSNANQGGPKPVVVRNDSEQDQSIEQENSSDKFFAHIGTINARNNIQTLSTASDESGTKVNMRNVMITCQSSHDLLDRAMREFQKSLAQLPYINQVAYYPAGTWPEPGGFLPDVFITVNMSLISEKSFLRSRYLKAVIKWTAGSSIFAGTSISDQAYTLPVIRFDIESQLEHESGSFGVEVSQTKYKLAANGICNEMLKSISKQFGNLLDKYGQMPGTPEFLYGDYQEPPELSFLKTNKARQLISGSGLLTNNHTVWKFEDERRTDQALMAYRDELKASGWQQEELGEDYLRMHKGNEHIYIFRQRKRDSRAGTILWSGPETAASDAFLIAEYESDFSDEQMKKAMGALLDSGEEMKTLLIFEKYFRTPKQLERLRSLVENTPTNTHEDKLMLCKNESEF